MYKKLKGPAVECLENGNYHVYRKLFHAKQHFLICMAQWLSRRGSIKTMRAQGLWFEARPDRTLSPGSGQKVGSTWT